MPPSRQSDRLVRACDTFGIESPSKLSSVGHCITACYGSRLTKRSLYQWWFLLSFRSGPEEQHDFAQAIPQASESRGGLQNARTSWQPQYWPFERFVTDPSR